MEHTETTLNLLRAVQASPGLNTEQELRYVEARTAGLYLVMRDQILNNYELRAPLKTNGRGYGGCIAPGNHGAGKLFPEIKGF